MTWNAAFPSSPLSRSAIRGDTTSIGIETEGYYRHSPLPSPRDRKLHPSPSPRDRLTMSTSPLSSRSMSASPRHPQHSPEMFHPSSYGKPRQGRRLSAHLSTSPTPNNLSLIGSYSESLLSGRMSTQPSRPFRFQADLGVVGAATGDTDCELPRHLNLDFDACFYALPDEYPGSARAGPGPSSAAVARSCSTSASPSSTRFPDVLPTPSPTATSSAPYVGTIDLEAHYSGLLHSSLQDAATIIPPLPPVFPGYKVPVQGQVQLLVKNPDLKTPIKLFLVPYDLRDMPSGSKTFLRQKIYVEQGRPADRDAEPSMSKRTKRMSLDAALSYRSPGSSKAKESMRYAIHLQFVAVPESSLRRRRKTKKFDENGDFRSSSLKEDSASVTDADKLVYYLHKSVRVVFSPRQPDKEETVKTYTETPAGQLEDDKQAGASVLPGASPRRAAGSKYATYAGPDEEWESLRKQVIRARKECKRANAKPDAEGIEVRQVSPTRREELEDEAADRSDISIATTASSLAPSEASVDSFPYPMDDLLNDQGHQVDAGTPHTSTYGFMPNADPNGEHWSGEGEAEYRPFEAMQSLNRPSQRTPVPLDHRAGHFGGPPPASLTQRTTLSDRSDAAAPALGIALRRDRSRTITPLHRRPSTTSSSTNGRSSPHRPSRSYPTTSTAVPSPSTSSVNSRPSSPFLSISTSLVSPALTATTRTSVSGVTSPLPSPLPMLSSSTSATRLGQVFGRSESPAVDFSDRVLPVSPGNGFHSNRPASPGPWHLDGRPSLLRRISSGLSQSSGTTMTHQSSNAKISPPSASSSSKRDRSSSPESASAAAAEQNDDQSLLQAWHASLQFSRGGENM